MSPMSTRVRAGSAILALAAILVMPSAAPAEGIRAGAYLTYVGRGEETVDREGAALEKISIFAYHLTADGDVLPSDPWVADVTDRLMGTRRDPVFLVTANNRILDAEGRPAPFHGGEVTYAFLSDPAKRAEHVRQLVALADSADGVELNYENFPPEARGTFTTLVRELRAALPAGKKLSIVLQPKTTNASGSRGRAVDWRAIAPHADYFRIMAYHYAWSTSAPGPVVPLETLRTLADYALRDPEQSIPREKVSIILALWGWDWPLDGNPGRLIPLAEALELARTHGVAPGRDPVEHSLRFRYVAADGVEHEVWIDDAQSIERRIAVLEEEGFPRVDFWHLNTGDPALWRAIAERTGSAPFPGTRFDGGRRTELVTFRPADGGWRSAAPEPGTAGLDVRFGVPGDVPVPADYDGDGVQDLAVFRPESGFWLIDVGRDGTVDRQVRFGQAGDVPVPADYDGDGITDIAVFRPEGALWFVDVGRDGTADLRVSYGLGSDVPVPGDYDGDGRADLAVFRPGSGTWWVDVTRTGRTTLRRVYGRAGDVPVPLDWDGDGRTDFAVFRPSYGGWWIDLTQSGGTDVRGIFGRPGDVPVPGNYDGDGVVDFAVFRPSTGEWSIDANRDGSADSTLVHGAAGDVPIRDGGWVGDALAADAG